MSENNLLYGRADSKKKCESCVQQNTQPLQIRNSASGETNRMEQKWIWVRHD